MPEPACGGPLSLPWDVNHEGRSSDTEERPFYFPPLRKSSPSILKIFQSSPPGLAMYIDSVTEKWLILRRMTRFISRGARTHAEGDLCMKIGKCDVRSMTLLAGLLVMPLAGCSGTGDDDSSPSPDVTATLPAETPTATLPAETPTATPDAGTPTPTGTPTDGTATPALDTPTATPAGGTPTPTPDPNATPTATPDPNLTPTPTAKPDRCLDAELTSIVDLQTDKVPAGTYVQVEGAVASSGLTSDVGASYQGFYIQTGTHQENGGLRVELATGSGLPLAPGKVVSVCGKLEDDRGTAQLFAEAMHVEVTGETPAPEAFVVDTCTLAIAGEVHEGQLVKVENVVTTNPSAVNQTFIVDECLQVGTEFFNYQTPPLPLADQPFKSITGTLIQVGEATYRLQPRTLDDMVQALFSYVEPSGQAFTDSITVTMKSNDASALIHYTLDGSEPTLSSPALPVNSELTFEATTTLKFFALSDTETEAAIHTEEYEKVRVPTTILISEISVQGTDQEFIELYNPTLQEVDLSQYYLTDLSNAVSNGTAMDNEFVKVTTGTIKPQQTDFLVRFPDGAKMAAGQRLVIVIANGATFESVVGVKPDYEMLSKNPDVPDMLPAVGYTLQSPSLTNDGEFVMLFTWNGTSKLVQDVDYFRWAADPAKNTGVDRTGVSVSGETYKADVALKKDATSQQGLTTHANGSSFCRKGPSEGAEKEVGGNGIDGADETSEDFSNTWEVCTTYTPGK